MSLFLQFIEYSSDPSKTNIFSWLQKKYKSFNLEVHVGVDVLHRKLAIIIADTLPTFRINNPNVENFGNTIEHTLQLTHCKF